jgi:membrane-associated phospholipid phosphatase
MPAVLPVCGLGSVSTMSTTEAPTFTPPLERARLRDAVPFEWLRPARLVLMWGYLAGYLWWLKYRGLTVDRISVAMAVGVFLLCAFVGKSWRTWGVLLLDCFAYCVMWLGYERTRGAADDGVSVLGLFRIRFPLQVTVMRDIDRVLFLGHDPTVVLQRHFWNNSVVRWYDVVAGTTYMTHFVLPMVVMAVLWAISHRQWARYMKRLASLLAVACLMFILLPTVPPWMAGSAQYPYRIIPTLHRNAGRGFYHLGMDSFRNSYAVALSNGNGVAAMPSLHASFALLTPAFFLPWIKPKWLKALLLVFPVLMLASLVYLAEHWVIDGLVGWALTGAAFWGWHRWEDHTRARRATWAREALSALPDAEPA